MKNENKNNKITIRMDNMMDEWEELPNHITCSRSEFIRQCIHEKVTQKDELSELKKSLKEKEYELTILNEEIEELKKKIINLENMQKRNLDDEILMSDLMDKVRNVANNEGLTEDRIIAIANDKVNPKVLMNKAQQEGFEILSQRKHQKKYVTDKDGNSHEVKLREESERSSFETLFNILKRHHHSSNNTTLLETLKKNNAHFTKLCEKYEDIDYPTFEKQVESLTQK